MVDIFQEVEEDLRAERMRSLAVRYGGAAFGVVILIVAAAGAWQGWRWWQGKQDAHFAEVYIKDMESLQRQRGRADTARLDVAISDLDKLAQAAPSGYRTLASLNSAALKAEKEDERGTLSTWDRVAGDAQATTELRQLATLMWAAHQVDSGDPIQIRTRLEGLAAAASSWTPLGRELLAVLDLREGKQDAAQSELKRVAGSSLMPTGLSGRAASLLASFGDQ